MPRPLVYGNGRMLIGMDRYGQIRDLCYPHVGLYNHVAGHPQKFGVWVNGAFSWLDSVAWERHFSYEQGSLIGRQILRHKSLGVELFIEEALHPEETAFVREVTVHNRTKEALDVRLFCYNDLRMEESEIGDCALYNPAVDAVVHFKGPHCLLFTGRSGKKGLYQYTTGHRGFEDYVGSWQDCEDGHLSFHPISQGMVDSAISVRLELDPGASGQGEFWVVAAKDIDAAGELYTHLRALRPAKVFDAVRKEGSRRLAPVSKALEGLDEDLVAFTEQSTLILLTQLDHQGGILAANDSDIMVTNKAHYSYVWPRDSALVARALDAAGLHDFAYNSLLFLAGLGAEKRGYFYQKYRIDGTLGCTWHPWIVETGIDVPCQQDETALTVLAIAEHHAYTGCSLEPFQGLLESAANWLLMYRDTKTGLPLQSHDLWEERKGVHSFTVATVIRAMEALVDILPCRQEELTAAAERMRESMLKHLFDANRGHFIRRVWWNNGEVHRDEAMDSSTLMIGTLGTFPPDHEALLSNRDKVKEILWIENGIGGVARYPGDWYFRLEEDVPGNPWIICSLWLAQSLIQTAMSKEDLEEPRQILQWVIERAETTGVMAEQFHPKTGFPLSVSPLTWSHAEVLLTSVMLAKKVRTI